MSQTPEERHFERIQHARWRVTFCESLLRIHRAYVSRDANWYERETDYLLTLKDARANLHLLEQGFATRAPEEAG